MNNIEIIHGAFPGTTVTVMGSIHGNERVGAHVLPLLKASILPEKLHGTLQLILGNPSAYAQDARFIDEDLNRLFGNQFEILTHKSTHDLNVEETRALELAPFLEKSDFLLDIHSTIKPSIPFVYCEPIPTHLELAHLFDVEYVVSAEPHFRPAHLISSADNFVDRHGGIGITYEAGWSQGPQNEPAVLLAAQQFLQKIGAYDFGLSLNVFDPQNLAIYDVVIPQDDSFKKIRDFSNFEEVSQGYTMAHENESDIQAKENSFIIFPKKIIPPGQVAMYLAHKISSS